MSHHSSPSSLLLALFSVLRILQTLSLQRPLRLSSPPGSAGGHFILIFQVSFTRFLQTFNAFLTICNYRIYQVTYYLSLPETDSELFESKRPHLFHMAVFPEPATMLMRGWYPINMYWVTKPVSCRKALPCPAYFKTGPLNLWSFLGEVTAATELRNVPDSKINHIRQLPSCLSEALQESERRVSGMVSEPLNLLLQQRWLWKNRFLSFVHFPPIFSKIYRKCLGECLQFSITYILIMVALTSAF